MPVIPKRFLNGRPYIVNLGSQPAEDTAFFLGVPGLGVTADTSASAITAPSGSGSTTISTPPPSGSGTTTPATTYATSFSISASSPFVLGAPSAVTVSPVGGAWHGQTVTLQPHGMSGTSNPPDAIGTGSSSIVFQFTPSTLASTATIDAAAAGMTSAGALNVSVVPSAPTGAWDALTPYSQIPLGWLNASAVPLPSPLVMTNQRLQRGDVPAGSHLGLFRTDGTAIVTQQDNEALPHSDGSLASATIAAYLPDTLAANGSAGSTGSYYVKAVGGAPDRTPKFTLATWATGNDIKLRICTNITNLSDDTANFEFRVSDAVAAGLYEGSSNGTDYPLTSIRADRVGPVCMGWRFKGYARRVSDGAWHRTLTGEIYVTASTVTDNWVEGQFKQAAATDAIGGNPLQTVGPTSSADLGPIIGIVQLWRNGALVRTWGGSGDYRAAQVTIDLTNNQALFPTSGQNQLSDALSYVFTSTGTLPGGVQPNTPYFSVRDYYPQKAWFVRHRCYVPSLFDSLRVSNKAYNVGDIISVVDYDRSNNDNPKKQQLYECVQAGTSGTTPPSGTGSNQADGSVLWSPANLKFTDAGTGTITVYPLVHIFQYSGAWFGDDQTTDPIWTGSGPAPHVEVIKDLTYLVRHARAFPPYDLTLPVYETGLPFTGFSVGAPPIPAVIDDFGDDPGTPRIGYLNVNASVALLAQTSVTVQRNQRAQALGWSDLWSFIEDPKALQPIVGNAGPGNAPGKYLGLAPSLPGFWYDPRGGVGANPGGHFLGYVQKPFNNNYYIGKYGTPLDGSHMPAFWTLSYEKTARTVFLDHGINLYVGTILGCYKGNNTTTASSRQYYNTALINQQERGSGWLTRILDTLDDVLPANHVMRPYLTDMIQDGLDFALAVIEENRTLNPNRYAMGILRRNGTLQMWMMAYFLTCTAQAARKARNPGWRTFTDYMASHLYLAVYDDDRGGSAGLIDWNFFEGFHVYGIDPSVSAGDTFTTTFNDWAGGAQSFTLPQPVTYTVTAGQTPAQVAAGIVALVNNTPELVSYGYRATLEGGARFRQNCPGGVFNPQNNHGQLVLFWNNSTGKLARSNNQAIAVSQIDEHGNVLRDLATVSEVWDYNLGPGWSASASAKLSFGYVTRDYQGPDGYVPWDTVGYATAHLACLATLEEAGFTKASTIYDRALARIQATGGGPRFSMIPYTRFSPDGTGRTYNNFDMVPFRVQATRTGR